ncbi:MAG: hypothetical protein ABL907_20665 [Hyphomicrobium sp.]
MTTTFTARAAAASGVALAAVLASVVATVMTSVMPGFISSQLLAATPPVDPLAHLVGRWVGNAVMTTSSGPANFKCIVTYLPRKDGPGMQQNLRCDNGANFKLHAATDLSVEGKKVSGHWKDKINEIEGTVTGNVTEEGFEVELGGQFFQAKMAVAGQGCDQSVKVMPRTSDMFTELAATLKKC